MLPLWTFSFLSTRLFFHSNWYNIGFHSWPAVDHQVFVLSFFYMRVSFRCHCNDYEPVPFYFFPVHNNEVRIVGFYLSLRVNGHIPKDDDIIVLTDFVRLKFITCCSRFNLVTPSDLSFQVSRFLVLWMQSVFEITELQ